MRGVLIDDDDAVARLRHDIGFVHLRAGSAERPVEQLGRGEIDACVGGGGSADVERRLRRLRQAWRVAAPSHRHAARIDRPRRRLPPVPAAAPRQRRTERGNGRAAAGRRGALAFAGERLLQRADEQAAHEAAVAEAHLGLGRMHVDVDLARIERDEQRHDGMAIARQIIGIGGAHHADEELVADRAAVDEQILAERIGAGERGQRGKALDRDRAVSAPHLDRIGAKLGAQNVGKPRQPSGCAGQRRRPGDRRTLLAREREGDVGPAHRQTAHRLADRLALAAVALEKFEPRRRRIEQVAHLDARAFALRRRLDLALAAAVDRDRPAVRRAGVTCRDGKMRHRADRGQSLAAEAERADVEQIIVRQFRGGVAFHRQRQVLARHAAAVVAEAD